jgi:hypothetical protein
MAGFLSQIAEGLMQEELFDCRHQQNPIKKFSATL